MIKERGKALSAILVTVVLLLTMSMSVAFATTPPPPSLDVHVVYITSPWAYTPEGWPVYPLDSLLSCEVHITNPSPKTYKHLEVTAIHEYFEDGFCRRWWWPYPVEVYFYKGEPLPGDSTKVWSDVTIHGNSELILTFDYYIPLAACTGLDQTDVSLKCTKGALRGVVFYSNPECGIFCI